MPSTKDIFDLIDDSEVIQITRDLVRIPSITHHEGRGIVDYYEGWFKDLHIPVRLYPYENDRCNFFADYGAVSGPDRFLFNGHQDTKPTGTMTVEPFGAEIRDGRMYGRGACDMKGGLAAILCAFKALVRAGKKPRRGITFVSDIEEEYGGQGGICLLLDSGLLDGYAGLISAEPSGLEINIGNRGGIATAFETRGRSAHSGLAYLGVNAIHNMAFFIREFLKLPYLSIENPWFGKCTVNFEKIEGGLYLSAVPDRCLACIDTRLIPETPPEMVREQINGLMDRMNREQGIAIRETDPPRTWREDRGGSPAAFIPPDHEFVLRTIKAFEGAIGETAVLSGCPGATLAGSMILRGTPSVICGPGALAQAHTDDEWVEVEQIPKAARIYAALMEEM
ncbi:MAG: M20/M25/M40 family metallo-hydrolase [Candidatus Latescibacter sp.]|nr:M20/M25/M40 family metallo-hydrolase [Candidatus Latescibacter sp.]